METIEILSSDDEGGPNGTGVNRCPEYEIIGSSEEEDDYDDDVSVIEILDDDLETDVDMDFISFCPSQAQPAQTQGGRQQQQQQHQLLQGLDLTSGSQPTFFTEFHIQRELYNMYVDGSYRDEAHWPLSTRMSAGGFTSHAGRAFTGGSWPQFSTLLLGGKPDSMRAELGAIHVGCQKLLGALQAQELDTGTCEVHMYTDCQGAANMLKRLGAKVPLQYKPLVSGVKMQLKQLKSQMPVRLKWVKGHQGDKRAGSHGRGNDEAHRRAQPSSVNAAVHLPTGDGGVDRQGPAAVAAAAAAAMLELRKTLAARSAATAHRGALAKQKRLAELAEERKAQTQATRQRLFKSMRTAAQHARQPPAAAQHAWQPPAAALHAWQPPPPAPRAWQPPPPAVHARQPPPPAVHVWQPPPPAQHARQPAAAAQHARQPPPPAVHAWPPPAAAPPAAAPPPAALLPAAPRPAVSVCAAPARVRAEFICIDC